MEGLLSTITMSSTGPGNQGDWSPSLEAVCQELDGSVALLKLDIVSGRTALLGRCSHWPEAEPLEGRARISPRSGISGSKQLAALSPGTVFNGNLAADLLSTMRFPERFQELSLCSRVMLGVTACTEISAEIVVIFARDAARSFAESDSRRLAAVLTHLARIRELRLGIHAYRQESQALATVLNHISTGCILVNERSYIRYMNAAAKHAIARSRVLRVTSGRLAGHAYRTSASLWKHVREIADDQPDRARLLSLAGPSDVAPALLRLVHVADHFERPEQVVAVVVHGDRPLEEDLLAEVCRTCELTPAERRLLSALARGGSLSEAGRSLDIGANTVHTHLQHLYAKLEVHNHAGLMHFLASRGII